jgi:hypothetical protein
MISHIKVFQAIQPFTKIYQKFTKTLDLHPDFFSFILIVGLTKVLHFCWTNLDLHGNVPMFF